MVAFNFKECFADDVATGRKPGTIRQSKRCNIGDKIQLYKGQRTKNCRKLGDAICTGVCKIRVTDDCPWSISEIEGEIHTRLVEGSNVRFFHEIDGFLNAMEFVDFFRQHYGLPFNGYYHQWELEGSE